MAYTETYTKLYLCSLTREHHARTCGYWYTVTTDGGTSSHTAFRRRDALLRWLAERGLTVEQPIPEPETGSAQSIVGMYHRTAHLDAEAFAALAGEHTRTLSNGDYVEAIITTGNDGTRTVHTLNPNVRTRRVFDYLESEIIYA